MGTPGLFSVLSVRLLQSNTCQIKLRGKEGQLLTKIQERKILLDHVRSIFAGSTAGIPELVRMPEEIFSVRNWEVALREVKPRKAVPRGEARMEAWKLDVSENARSLSELSVQFLCSDAPWIPTSGVGFRLPGCPSRRRRRAVQSI